MKMVLTDYNKNNIEKCIQRIIKENIHSFLVDCKERLSGNQVQDEIISPLIKPVKKGRSLSASVLIC
jgi:hypothetical protein